MNRLRLFLLPVLILLAGFAVTFTLWHHERQASQRELLSQFDHAMGDTVGRVEQRMATYEELLRGAQGLFIASGSIDLNRFRDYINAVNSDPNFAGVASLGVVQWVRGADYAQHVDAMHKLGMPNYAIKPAGVRDNYGPVILREPHSDGKRDVTGFDAWNEPQRRTAMEQSRDSGLAVVSGKVRLTIDTDKDTQPGFVMYLPLYARGAPQDTVEQRRAALIGWVYASFHMHDVVASLYGEQPAGVSMAIYDGVEPTPAALMYRKRDANAAHTPVLMSANEYLVVGGHDWLLSLEALDSFEARYDRKAEWLIFFTGTGLSLLLAVLAWSLGSGRSRAMRLASVMTRELRESEQKFRAIADCAVNLDVWWGPDGKPRWINPSVKEYTGYTVDECMAMDDFAATLIHPEDMPRVAPELTRGRQGLRGTDLEFRCVRKDGSTLWLSVSWEPIYDAQGAFTGFRTSGRDITERKKAEAQIKELAFYDSLTRLPNRTLLWERIRDAIAASAQSGAYGALLFIDLDNFKTLNDTLGHDKGDLLLRQVAQRLARCVREGDTVARVGGDEFVVVLGGLGAGRGQAIGHTGTVGTTMLELLGEPYELDGIDYRTSASIGATVFRGHKASIDELLKQADLAMYRSKERGRNAMCFFDPSMQTVVMERAAMEAALRRAIEEDQFFVQYQAQVNSKDRVTGAEALVRWQHPERGLMQPSEFIPLAEDTGLILELGSKVMETACLQLARWAMNPMLAHLVVAVNVSVRQFRDARFVERIMTLLARTGADPTKLKIELTESVLVENARDIIQKISALKAIGVAFSLDDFGVGYSSLSYLKRLPLDELKIDRSFVRDVLVDANDAVIARTIVALAQTLGLGVIAEGVETETQRDFLVRAGCHAFQGFYFARPLPVELFETFVAGYQRRQTAVETSPIEPDTMVD
ncbi:EAL domain-containing protein [Paraburkholderia phosphatilytica]|uniref:bifunctional diguanylate cyclase/phosphodiesterase n=1 Tax=Paraburkholderia phosphatilytica TaxID=2282883 RepID=UPI000E52E9BD|nr:EAL domain-containing protein [Paraburkholderia phosphatilytica]